jgi:hypothetical protein
VIEDVFSWRRPSVADGGERQYRRSRLAGSRVPPKDNFVYADGKSILLGEDDQLALVCLSPQGMNVMAKAAVLKHTAWTPPTLVCANLYLRDRRTMLALELK